MKLDPRVRHLLGIAQSKAKMWEYNVPIKAHIKVIDDPAKLFDFAIASLGDIAAAINQTTYLEREHLTDEVRSTLKFAALFFDSFHLSKLCDTLGPYNVLCASATYYFFDMPGSSTVLARQLHIQDIDIEASGLEKILLVLLRPEFRTHSFHVATKFQSSSQTILQLFPEFVMTGNHKEELIWHADSLKNEAYNGGSPRELLFADIIAAMLRMRIKNSIWTLLPLYTNLPIETWIDIARRPSFMREFWPSQRLMGEKGVLRGESAVVQMPTSAGKTKATELIIRSAFLADRTFLAIIVAPFRALCHEIMDDLQRAFDGDGDVAIDELSDVIQHDFTLETFLNFKQVLIVTPEKLSYILRHHKDLARRVGIVIYDEGHLFDDGTRGVNYELLIASIKSQLPSVAQTILISAVIQNVEQVKEWLLGDNGAVVLGKNINPTYRSIAFTSWETSIGQLQFTNPVELDDYEFFVPRILEQYQLLMKPRERRERVFPQKKDSSEIALYLGLKLVVNGSVTIFCGQKNSASKICEIAVGCFERGLPLPAPRQFSNEEEVQRLILLYARNFGTAAIATKAAELGIYAHHASVPQGIRLAIEYAMQQGFIKLVVCTSTLAQGINLPIRYLIVSNAQQGRERIKIRDFHNLMGRTGRAGMYTEGTLIFANPEIFDTRGKDKKGYLWLEVTNLLNPENSEHCKSSIQKIFTPLENDRGDFVYEISPLELVAKFLNNPKGYCEIAEMPELLRSGFSTPGINAQLEEKANAIRAIQSYLLAHEDEWLFDHTDINVNTLVEGTLAFFLSPDQTSKDALKELFALLAQDILRMVPSQEKRQIFGRSFFGAIECLIIDEWLQQNLQNIESSHGIYELLQALWPILSVLCKNNTFSKCSDTSALQKVGLDWIRGVSFELLYEYIKDARIGSGLRPHRFTLGHVVEICEKALGYDGSLTVGAIAELLQIYVPDNDVIKQTIATLQKSLKYGLPSDKEIILFELGFSDRPLAIEVATIIQRSRATKASVVRALKRERDIVLEILENYPSYFNDKISHLLN